MSRRHHYATHRTETLWNVVIKDAPIGLGYIVRLEHGENYAGPSQMLPRVLDWWWRPTFLRALNKGYREARTHDHWTEWKRGGAA